jgi:hypothetical protein
MKINATANDNFTKYLQLVSFLSAERLRNYGYDVANWANLKKDRAAAKKQMRRVVREIGQSRPMAAMILQRASEISRLTYGAHGWGYTVGQSQNEEITWVVGELFPVYSADEYDIPQICKNFKETLLWAEFNTDNDPSFDDAVVTGHHKSLDLTISKSVKQFIKSCISLSLPPPALSKAGHNLALSMQGHGAGFFDCDETEPGLRDSYQDVARDMRTEINLYLTPTNRIGAY